MHTYAIAKHIHMAAAATSGAFFVLRGLWLMYESKLNDAKLVKVLPHVIDTVLLVSALTLVALMGSLPTWVEVKVIALFVYIGLGMAAFRASGQGTRLLFFFLALFTFGFIISVAITKNPHGFLGHFI